MHDKIIKINDTWNIVEKDRNICIEDIAESYEHNINTTINDFFKYVLRRFDCTNFQQTNSVGEW